MAWSREKQTNYIDNGGYHCPECDHWARTMSVLDTWDDGNAIYRSVQCGACGHRITETFKLTSYDDEDE